jgi:O-antigen/teichoic acid export membrane protein
MSLYTEEDMWVPHFSPNGAALTSFFIIIFVVEERTIKLNALKLINNLVRLLIIISLLLIIFLIPYSSIIINIYIGSKYSSFILYFRLYLIIILLNSINIINESFIQSIISNKQLNILLFYSFIYLFLSYIFIKLFGLIGIIIINSLNIFGRIIINNYLIRIQSFKYYLFSSHYIFILLISFIIFYLNQYLIQNYFGQIAFAIGLILTIICFTFIEEKQMIHYIYCVFKLNHQKQRSQFVNKHWRNLCFFLVLYFKFSSRAFFCFYK